jgi:NADH-quinone oxidoreductase subunit N
MVAGNVVALVQSNVKRMLAYSSVAHAGYILAGLAAGTAAGYGAALFYLLAYTLMNVGAFGVMGALEWDNEQGAGQDLDSLAGVGYRKPFLGVAMGVFMFALTGFPPLAGFIGKYLVFAAAVDAGLVWLAILGVLASVVSGYYYLRVLVVMWMKSPDEAPDNAKVEFPVARATAAVVAVCAIALLVLGVLPAGVIDATAAAFGVDALATVAP